MIRVKLIGGHWRGLYIRLGDSDEENPCRLVDSQRTWHTAQAGDAVMVRRGLLTTELEQRVIESITLSRAYPKEFNGTVVESAQSWLNGKS